MSILSSNMRGIIGFLRLHGRANLTQIIEGTGLRYHNNTRKYVCETLGRMVKNGTIRRPKKGFYEYRSEFKRDKVKVSPAAEKIQLNLFNS